MREKTLLKKLSVRLSPKLLSKIDSLRKSEQLDRSELIRRALENYVKKERFYERD